MDFVIGLILLAVVIVSARWVGLIPLFGPEVDGRRSDARTTRREHLERRMREVPDE
jgi:hypothetical protein